ncbi:MAG: hypothetical protein IJ315_05930 [Firmicutes bacterium]|nr:hypothetical protein [Bacillota bacterium]
MFEGLKKLTIVCTILSLISTVSFLVVWAVGSGRYDGALIDMLCLGLISALFYCLTIAVWVIRRELAETRAATIVRVKEVGKRK